MIYKIVEEKSNIELDMGKKVEMEHRATWKKIQDGKINTLEEMVESIAKDHLKEHKNYYTKLKEAKL